MSTDLMKPVVEGLVLASGSQDYSEDAGRGTKGVDSSHFAPPFLNVAQDLSKLVKSREANVGDFFISSTSEVFDGKKGVVLVVCGVERYFVEWRANNGGFVARHNVTSEVVEKARQTSEDGFKLKNGANSLLETFSVFGILVREDGSFAEVVMPFASTKIGPYKKELVPRVFNVCMKDSDGRPIRNKIYPSYAHALRITSRVNPRGNTDSYNVVINYVGETADKSRLDRESDIYRAAASFAKMVEGGQVRSDSEHGSNDDIPF